MTSKSILITGCSSGIGLCAAMRLKQRGYRVFATARNEADVQKLLNKGFESFRLDVNDSQSIQQVLAQILQLTGGKLDALFNNAGFVQAGAVEDITRDMQRAQFETNVFGPMELVRLILPVMRQQGHGRIIQNSSILGVVCVPYTGAYNASKYALEGFTNTLRQELRSTGIHVILINPGPIASQIKVNATKHFQTQQVQFEKSHYQAVYKSMAEKQAKGNKTLVASPDAVVDKLIHALESSRPKAHYFVGIPAHAIAILRRILPDFALDWITSKSK